METTVLYMTLAESKAAIAAVKKAGRTGKARSRHLQRTVIMIAEIREGGEVKFGWDMGILGNEAADVETGSFFFFFFTSITHSHLFGMMRPWSGDLKA